jgi:hypothetical protein
MLDPQLNHSRDTSIGAEKPTVLLPIRQPAHVFAAPDVSVQACLPLATCISIKAGSFLM